MARIYRYGKMGYCLNGWEWKNLGEELLLEIIMGQSPPGESYNDEGNGLPFFQGKTDFGDYYPTPRKWCTSPTKISLPGDVLLYGSSSCRTN